MKNIIHIIHITDNYYFCSDKCSLILLCRRPKMDAPSLGIKSNGEYVYDEVGYYSSMRTLLTALPDVIIRREVESGELKTLGQILYRLNEIQCTIDDIT